MADKLNRRDAVTKAVAALHELASKQLRVLLETKHLYQRVSIDPQQVIESIRGEVIQDEKPAFDAFVEQVLPSQPVTISMQRLFVAGRGSAAVEEPCVLVENVKVFCPACGEREVFSPAWIGDLDSEMRTPALMPGLAVEEAPSGPVVQVFVLAYRCQRCKGKLEAFLVRREGWHLSLHGRSPMEQVEVPKHIPKTERHFFRDAIVAMHGGKPLAALFYLRTFVEQFARRQTGMIAARATGDEIMDAYSKTLPDAHRGHMPSLKVCYDKLSEALHSARPDEALLGEAIEQIDRHFDIRRVFKIPESPTSGT